MKLKISNAFTSSYTYTPLANTTLRGSVLSNNADTFLVGVASILISKTVDKTFANVGDTITYTLNLKNIGTTTATGLSMGTIPAGGVTTLSFNVTVNTIPLPNPIPNSGVVNYNYIVDPSLGTTGSRSNNTNIVN